MPGLLGWEWQWTLFTPILFVAALVMGAIATYAWRNRETTGASAFVVLMAAAALWAFAYGVQIAGATESTARFWANVVHVGVAAVPVAWFCFTVQFTGRDHWLTRRSVLALSVVPAVYVALVFTNEYHYLVRQPLGLEHTSLAGETIIIYRQAFGPVFYAHAAYGYALMVAGIVLLVHLLFWSPTVYRRQVGLLLGGVTVTMATNILHHAGVGIVENFDPTPFSFAIAGVTFLVAIYYYQLLDLRPVAREFVVDTLQDGVIVLDTDDRIVDTNHTAEALLALDGDDAIGERLDTIVPGAGHDDGSPPNQRKTTTPTEEPIEYEFTLESPSNRRHLHLVSTPVYDVREEYLGRSIVVRDVTETRRLEAEVETTLERLRRSNEELESFASVVSHDLRGPLRTIERYLSTLEASADALEQEDAELLAVAHETAERSQAMVADLLEYARIGSADDEFEPVDCNEVLTAVLESLRYEIDDRAATVEVGELPTVVGVEHQLQQLFQNLVSNALAYAGEEAPSIDVRATPVGDAWQISVEDTGEGIDPALCEHVFERFTRAGRTDGTGTGMGLAICAKIAEHHGGTIDLESTPGEGTVVTVTLPSE